MKFIVLTIIAACCVATSNSMIQQWIEGTTDFNSMWNSLTRTMPRGFQIVIQKSSGFQQQNNPVPTTYSFMGFGPTDPMPTEPPTQPATEASPIEPIVTDKPSPPTPPPQTVEKVTANEPKKEEATCTAERRNAGHTLCMKDSPGLVKEKSFLTKKQEKALLDHHNRLRGTVEPPAADLVRLVWDDRVAKVAQKWANTCGDGHDPNRELDDELGMSVGQNVAGGYPKFEQAVQAWWDEYKMWKYGIEPDSYLGFGGWKKIGHFTQMAQNGTFLLGCGFAYCSNTKYNRHYVCNYAAGQSNIASPYTKGKRCQACPKSCFQGTCDCKGRVCQNGGTLDVNTCQCSCTKLYKGPLCEELNCPAKDDRVCGRQWTFQLCDKFYNVPEECPYMCGICQGDGANTVPADTGSSRFRVIKQNPTGPVFTSPFNCKYRGERANLTECRTFKSRGLDRTMCASEGGKFGCDACEKYSNIATDMCPVMCGLCDAQCNGLKCKNDGTLNLDTCKCECKPPYIGETCAKADCANIKDEKNCKYYQKSYCDKFSNVKGECPFKCGIC